MFYSVYNIGDKHNYKNKPEINKDAKKFIRQENKLDYLKIAEDYVNNIEKYLDFIKKYNDLKTISKYMIYAVHDYRIAEETLIKIENERLNKYNSNKNKGIEEFKNKKYDVFVISKNIADDKDRQLFDRITREIILMNKIKKLKKETSEIIDEYFGKTIN